jgi:hypothetical protein
MSCRRPLLIVLALALAPIGGCYGQGRYATELAEETCVLYDACGVIAAYGHGDLDSCIEATEAALDPDETDCGDYDPKAARACAWGIREMDCQDLEDLAYPEDCGTVCGEPG